MTLRKQRKERPRRRRVGVPVAVVVWLALCAGGSALVAESGDDHIATLARHEARAVFDTVVEFRAWNASHGGVWVDASPEAPPNPLLPPDRRTRTTTDGETLALVNPAYMTRMVGERSAAGDGPLIRITSLDPLRPKNAALPWERRALQAFESGVEEYGAFVDDGSSHYRYAAPLHAEQACLRCHAQQGYQVGDLRGAVTVSLPAAHMITAIVHQRRTAWTLGALVAAIGVVAILLLGLMAAIRRDAVDRLRDLSLRDPLTGLHNRRGFRERSEQALHTLAREHGTAVLAFADLDGLKTINDTHGHKRGDEALTRLASNLRGAFRGSDVVARIGGDEFAILFVDAKWEYHETLQRRLDNCVEHANAGWTSSVPIEVSVGMVDIDLTAEDAQMPSIDTLLSRADERMYQVKTERRDSDRFKALPRDPDDSGDSRSNARHAPR